MNAHPGLIDWIDGPDTGLSSMALAMLLGFGKQPSRPGHPLDPDDFGRCERLLRAVPTLRPLLPAMKPVSPIWAQLVDHWDELVQLGDNECPGMMTSSHARGTAPAMYARMRELITAGREAAA